MEHQQSFYSPRIGARVGLVVVGSVGVVEKLGINDGVEVVLGVVGSDVGSDVGGNAIGLLVGNVVDGRNVGAIAGAMDGRTVGTIDGSDIKVTYPQIFVEMVIFKL